MLNKLIGQVMKKVIGVHSFDPSTLNDPVAMKTDWTPLADGGSNFRTHKLVAVSYLRYEFKATNGAKLFSLIFILMGFGFTAYFFNEHLPFNEADLQIKDYLNIVGGFAFVGGGVYLMHSMNIPVVFDKSEAVFWKGKNAPSKVFDMGVLKAYCELADIYALQIISEYCAGGKNSYLSYELNLVLKDGSRINVVDHGNRHCIEGDAATIARFLNKPVWSAL